MAAIKPPSHLRDESDLYDFTETIVTHLLGDSSTFRDYLEAVCDEEAVEGSMFYDDCQAARLVRDYAIRNGIRLVRDAKLKTGVRILRDILTRMGVSREQRRGKV